MDDLFSGLDLERIDWAAVDHAGIGDPTSMPARLRRLVDPDPTVRAGAAHEWFYGVWHQGWNSEVAVPTVPAVGRVVTRTDLPERTMLTWNLLAIATGYWGDRFPITDPHRSPDAYAAVSALVPDLLEARAATDDSELRRALLFLLAWLPDRTGSVDALVLSAAVDVDAPLIHRVTAVLALAVRIRSHALDAATTLTRLQESDPHPGVRAVAAVAVAAVHDPPTTDQVRDLVDVVLDGDAWTDTWRIEPDGGHAESPEGQAWIILDHLPPQLASAAEQRVVEVTGRTAQEFGDDLQRLFSADAPEMIRHFFPHPDGPIPFPAPERMTALREEYVAELRQADPVGASAFEEVVAQWTELVEWSLEAHRNGTLPRPSPEDDRRDEG